MGHPLAIERLGETRAGAGSLARQAEREKQLAEATAASALDAETHARFHGSIHRVGEGLKGVVASGKYSGLRHEFTFGPETPESHIRSALKMFERAAAPGPKRVIRAPDGHWVIVERKPADGRTIVVRAARLHLVK